MSEVSWNPNNVLPAQLVISDGYREHLVPLLPGKAAGLILTRQHRTTDCLWKPWSGECAHGFFVSPCLRRELR